MNSEETEQWDWWAAWLSRQPLLCWLLKAAPFVIETVGLTIFSQFCLSLSLFLAKMDIFMSLSKSATIAFPLQYFMGFMKKVFSKIKEKNHRLGHTP